MRGDCGKDLNRVKERRRKPPRGSRDHERGRCLDRNQNLRVDQCQGKDLFPWTQILDWMSRLRTLRRTMLRRGTAEIKKIWWRRNMWVELRKSRKKKMRIRTRGRWGGRGGGK